MPKFNTLFLSCAAALSLPVVADDIKSYQSFSGASNCVLEKDPVYLCCSYETCKLGSNFAFYPS